MSCMGERCILYHFPRDFAIRDRCEFFKAPTKLHVIHDPEVQRLTCRFGNPQDPFVYKTSAVQEMARIVSWEMSSRLELTFQGILSRPDIGNILSPLWSGSLGAGVCLGTRPGLYLAQRTDISVVAWAKCQNMAVLVCMLCLLQLHHHGKLFGRQTQIYLALASRAFSAQLVR